MAVIVRRLLVPCLAGLLLGGAATPAHAAQPRQVSPLVDQPPPAGATSFQDRVLAGARRTGPVARAAQARAQAYRTAAGETVHVALSPSYASSPAAAQSYVDFLGGLVHGDELGDLGVLIATPGEVVDRCGGGDGVLACYLPGAQLMIVPGEEIPGSPVPVSYVVAHEYGHHVANHRSNAPFPAMLFGPKRWASAQDVCAYTLDGRLAPGDEDADYASNPGEAWAETYAQLKYPQAAWNFTPLLKPSPLTYLIAHLDVTRPWTRSRTRTFRGSLSARDRADRHTFKLTLDGALSIRLDGPRRADFDLLVRSGGQAQGRTRARGSRDRLDYAAACVKDPETIAVTVRRRSGSGAYRLRVVSAG